MKFHPRLSASTILTVLIASGLIASGCEPLPKTADSPVASSSASAAPTATTAPEQKLEIVDLTVGKGLEAKKGSAVTVHYVGTLQSGTQFDSSIEHGKPFSFIIGLSAVIEGWHRGVVGMRVGGKRKLTVPPDLGYGDAGSPPSIPPHATLIFEIELLHVVE